MPAIKGLRSVHVVGTSYGAYASLLLAARHPERVRALVLSDPPVLPLLEHNPEGSALRDDFLAEVWEPAGEMMQRGAIEDGVRVFVDGVVEEGTSDQFPPEVQNLIMDNACEFEVETSSPGFWTPFTREDAERMAAPTLLLTGDQSLRWLQLIVEELERCLPNNESATVPETTREVTSDNPEAYNGIVLEFLARHSASAAVRHVSPGL